MDAWFGWLEEVLHQNWNVLSSCSFSKTSERLLLTKRNADAQTGQNDFAVRERKFPGYFFTVTVELRAHLYFTPGSSLHVHHSRALKKPLRETFVMEETETMPTSVFVGHEFVQPAGSKWRRGH